MRALSLLGKTAAWAPVRQIFSFSVRPLPIGGAQVSNPLNTKDGLQPRPKPEIARRQHRERGIGHGQVDAEPHEIDPVDGKLVCLAAPDPSLETAACAPELVDICVRGADNRLLGLDAVGQDRPRGEVNEADAACSEALDGWVGEGTEREAGFEGADDRFGN